MDELWHIYRYYSNESLHTYDSWQNKSWRIYKYGIYVIYIICNLYNIEVSFAKYSLFCWALLQKRPIVLRSLLIVATPSDMHSGRDMYVASLVGVSKMICGVSFLQSQISIVDRVEKKLQLQLEYHKERWGAGVETQKNVREEIGGWGRVPFNEPYAPLLSTIYDGA